MAVFWTACVVVCLSTALVQALPVDPKPGEGRRPIDPANVYGNPGRVRRVGEIPGLDNEEYNRYWQEMARANPAMQEQMKRMNPEDLARLHPRVSERMARDSGEIRNRLEEARRMNMEEMRDLQRLQMMQDRNKRLSPDAEWVARQQAMRDNLPTNFDSQQLQKRIEEQQRVLEEIDRKRRENFQQYEMQLEHRRREKLKAMSEQDRLRAEEDMRQLRQQQLNHERLNQPASKQQLEEVWEKDDGLKGEEFDAKTFFFLHDTDGDRNLNSLEMEALFYNEVKKAYGSKNVDNVKFHEEMARMREFAVKQLDSNRDGLVSLEEFVRFTREDEFEENEEWEPVADKEEEAFAEEELENYDDYDYYDYEYDEQGNVVGFQPKKIDQATPPSMNPPVVNEHMTGDPEVVQQHPSDSIPTDHQREPSSPSAATDEQQPQGGGLDMSEQAQLNVQAADVQQEGRQQFQKNPEDQKHIPSQQDPDQQL